MRPSRLVVTLCVAALVAFVALAPRVARAGTLEDALAFHATYRSAASQTDRELAQYRLAVALYEADLHAASFAFFAEIADHPSHVRFRETLPWLARLARDLPDAADVGERLAKYDERTIESTIADPTQLGDVRFLVGREWYRNRRYDDALRLLGEIEPSARRYGTAQLWAGMANVQLREPEGAIRAFARAAGAQGEGEDATRVASLAELSIARTYYSWGIRLDGAGAPLVDSQRLSTALTHFRAVDPGSGLSDDAMFEAAWAHALLGDHARALGALEFLRAGKGTYENPEIDVLRSTLYLASCRYDDVATLTARFHQEHEPVATDLANILSAHTGDDEAFYTLFRDVRSGRGAPSAATRASLAEALSDRTLLRTLDWVDVLDHERARLRKTPDAFRTSLLGDELTDVLELSREIAARNAGELARSRVERALAALLGNLRTNTKLLDAAVAGRRGALDEAQIPLRVPSQDSERNIVRADDEHVIWPYNGEQWRDEAGSYRQSLRSSCR
jgi:tetratricopeptide (TPR) repeat protein